MSNNSKRARAFVVWLGWTAAVMTGAALAGCALGPARASPSPAVTGEVSTLGPTSAPPITAGDEAVGGQPPSAVPTTTPGQDGGALALPHIDEFAADQTEVNVPGQVTFRWNATAAQVFFCNGAAQPPAESCSVVDGQGSATVAIDRAASTLEAMHFGLIATNNLADPDAGPVEKALIVVTAHCAACAPPTLVPPPTATAWPAGYQDAWSTYTDLARGFAFDYPTFYDALSGCGVTPNPWADNPAVAAQFGSETSLAVVPANGLALEAYVDQFIAALDFEPRRYHHKRALSSGQTPGFIVDSAVMHHGVTWVYFQRGDEIFVFFARHNLGCMAPEIGFNNPEVFYRVVESFRFEP